MSDSKYVDGKLNFDDERVTEVDLYGEYCAVHLLTYLSNLLFLSERAVDPENLQKILNGAQNLVRHLGDDNLAPFTDEEKLCALMGVEDGILLKASPQVLIKDIVEIGSLDQEQIVAALSDIPPYVGEDEGLGITLENLTATRERIQNAQPDPDPQIAKRDIFLQVLKVSQERYDFFKEAREDNIRRFIQDMIDEPSGSGGHDPQGFKGGGSSGPVMN